MFLTNGQTLGIDLGATGARAMKVGWAGGRPTVEGWAAADFPLEIKDWQNINRSEIVGALRGMLADKGLRARWAAHSVAGESVAPQYFNFPQLMPDDVGEAVRLEVETALPFRIDEALISYVLFPEQKIAQGKVRTHGLAIAAEGDFVESRLRVIREASLEPFCLEADSTACANAFLATRRLPDGGTTAVLNMGHRYSNLALLGGANAVLVRDLPWAGAQITQAIAEALTISIEEAEEAKREYWKSPNGPLASTMPGIFQTSGRDFVGRLRDTIEYWISERLVPGLGHVFLTGGGSQVHGLPEYLSEALSVPVQRWSPVLDAAGGQAEALKPWAYRLTVAFGLGLRHFERKKS